MADRVDRGDPVSGVDAPAAKVVVVRHLSTAVHTGLQLAELQRELGVALLFISHDLGVIHHVSDRVIVMKDGRLVETGNVGQLFDRPAHPHPRELLAAPPRPDRSQEGQGSPA
ncbi:hypothetical protein [Streptomyces sp. NPDC050548]|uniref:hypothetical protein n=1 Tax=Streptomyces sp. NPDC050548 TaxID=3365629 RepID=UPI0037BA0DF3